MAGAITHLLANPGALPGEVDDDLGDPGRRQRVQVIVDERMPTGLEQRLGTVVGQRPHALAAAGSEDDGPHVAASSRNCAASKAGTRRWRSRRSSSASAGKAAVTSST